MDDVILLAEDIAESIDKGWTNGGKTVMVDGHKVIVSWELYELED